EALAEALHLEEPAPRRSGGDDVVALRERGRRRGVSWRGARIANVHVDQLRAERAAEGRAQVADLGLKRRRLAVWRQDDLEFLQVERARVEVVGGGVGVVAGTVVVVRRVGDVEENGARREVEHDAARYMRRRAGRTLRDDVEHARSARHGDGDAE